MLRVRDLAKRLGDFSMRNVSFDVADGGYFVLLGASGVGKTVLLETIAGLMTPDHGTIHWDDTDLLRAPVQKRRMGLVYQDQALFPHKTVHENIAYGLHGRKRSRGAARERVATLADDVGVTDLLDRFPETLSGGEAQRVALARALATEPRCLLLDEPLSSLDIQARSAMRALLRRIHRNGHTTLHVTHDYEEAVSLATRVGVMENGTIVQIGAPNEVFHHPKSEFVARFIGIRNFFNGRLENRDCPTENRDCPKRATDRERDGTVPVFKDGATPVFPLGRFVTDGLAFLIVTDARPGPGCVSLRSEDITVSRTRTDTSARNCFLGTVVDIVPARLGVEVAVDIGVEVAALVTAGSVERLGLRCGQKVWVSFKATAARFFEG